MENEFMDRLIEEIRASGVPMRRLSVGVGGENYVWQLTRDRKEPTLTKFVNLARNLGPGSLLYIVYGIRLDAEAIEVLGKALELKDETARRMAVHYLEALQNFRETEQTQEPRPPNRDPGKTEPEK